MVDVSTAVVRMGEGVGVDGLPVSGPGTRTAAESATDGGRVG